MGTTHTDNRNFVHQTNDQGIIIYINDEWIAFAEENGASYLPKSVLNTPIREHISGVETRQIYGVLVEKSRATAHPIKIRYRCDSPCWRRFMEMEVVFMPEKNRFQFSNRIVRLEQREPVWLLDLSKNPNTDDIISMCSWCKKVRLSGNAWVEAEVAIETLKLFQHKMPQISHGICHECTQRIYDL